VSSPERIEAPTSVPAGRTQLVEENDRAEAGHAFVLRIPDDVAEADLAETLAGSSAVEKTPQWFWRAEFVGNGDRAVAGRPAIVLVDLRPGRYLAGDPFRPASEYARFEVFTPGEAETPSAPDPRVDVIGELFEMGIDLPDRVPAGRQTWELRNTGALLHEMAIVPVPADATKEDVQTATAADLEALLGGDPAKARATIDALGAEWAGWSGEPVAGIGVLSPRHVSWALFDLPPGTYGAVCFVPDQTSGAPHLMLGMTAVFTVEAPSA
jgi:hypothetical protein